MVIDIPLRAKLVTEEETARLEERAAAARAAYVPARGFLVDEPLTRSEPHDYPARPARDARSNG